MTNSNNEFENAYFAMNKFFGDVDFSNKEPFEIFQIYRNAFVDFFSANVENAETLEAAKTLHEGFYDLQFFDEAYFDNFFVCLKLKLQSSELYNEIVPTLDQYIRPNKKTPALEYARKSAAGIFVNSLVHHQNMSRRYASHIVGYLYGISEKSVERQSKAIEGNSKYDFSKFLEPEIIAFIFYLIVEQNFENLKPIALDNKKSQNALIDSISIFNSWLKVCSEKYVTQIKEEIDSTNNVLLKQLDEDEFNYMASLPYKDVFTIEDVLWISVFASIKKLLPTFFEKPHLFLKNMTDDNQ